MIQGHKNVPSTSANYMILRLRYKHKKKDIPHYSNIPPFMFGTYFFSNAFKYVNLSTICEVTLNLLYNLQKFTPSGRLK